MCSRFVGCLAFVAVWLSVVVPVISRSIPDGTGAMNPSSECASHGLGRQHRSTSTDLSTILDKCRYCQLSYHRPLVAGDAMPAVPRLMLSEQTLIAVTGPHRPLSQLPSAALRGPPVHD